VRSATETLRRSPSGAPDPPRPAALPERVSCEVPMVELVAPALDFLLESVGIISWGKTDLSGDTN
jgi:hypothetical protein